MLLIKIVYITTLSSHKIPKGLHISLTFRLVSSPTFADIYTLLISSSERNNNEKNKNFHSIEKHTFDDEDD